LALSKLNCQYFRMAPILWKKISKLSNIHFVPSQTNARYTNIKRQELSNWQLLHLMSFMKLRRTTRGLKWTAPRVSSVQMILYKVQNPFYIHILANANLLPLFSGLGGGRYGIFWPNNLLTVDIYQYICMKVHLNYLK
jgi:hypothetical protein